MNKRLTSRHLRVAFFAMLVILVAGLAARAGRRGEEVPSTATGRSTATTTMA